MLDSTDGVLLTQSLHSNGRETKCLMLEGSPVVWLEVTRGSRVGGRGLSENRQLNWDLGDKSGQLSKTSLGRAFQAEVTAGAGLGAEQVDRLNTSVTEAEWARERAEKKSERSAPGGSCSGWGLPRNSASNRYHHKAKEGKKKVGEFEGLLYNITSGTWIWL